ncbi:MAG: PAS domain S-box protein [Candidatus Aminicenantes bacterium]
MKTKQKLRENEKLLRILIEAIPDSVYFKDKEGRNILVNKAFENLVGKNRKDILGKKDSEFLPSQLAAQCVRSDREAATKKKMFRVQEKITNQKGEPIYFETSKSPIMDEKGEIQGMVGISRDVTENKKARDALKESEKEIRRLLDGIPVGIYRTTPKGESINGNLSLMRLLGFPDQKTMMETNAVETYVNPEDRTRWQEEMEKKDRVMGFEIQLRRYDGKIIWGRESARAIRNKEGDIVCYEGVIEDITGHKKMEQALNEERAYFDHLFEDAPEAITVTDGQGKILRTNKEFTSLFGFTKQEAEGRIIDDLIAPGEYYEEAVSITRSSAQGQKTALETRRRHKSGKWIDISLLTSPVIVNGEQVVYYGIYRDIAPQKKAEALIKSSLEEKEVMLREIHHRVKNNLQVIISLLRLQSGLMRDKQDLEMFKESQNRIMSMALIHEKLYRSQDLAKIDFPQYIQSFATHLFRIYQVDHRDVHLYTDIDDLFLDINRAIPLGLIVNELLSNALKHAFPGGRKGNIWIELHSGGDGKKLSIKDNGVGLPENFNFKNADTLGIQLVSSLINQIKGTLELKTAPETAFTIYFS